MHGNLLFHLLQIVNENTMQRLSLFSLGTVNAKTGYNKPKTEKHYQTEEKHKSQNRNKHPKAETHTKKNEIEPQN